MECSGADGGDEDCHILSSASTQLYDHGVDNALEWGTQGNDRGPYVHDDRLGQCYGRWPWGAAAFYVETDNGSYEIRTLACHIPER